MRQEAVIIMESACYSVSSIPYARDKEGLFISPNDILMQSYEMASLAEAESPLANVNMLIEKNEIVPRKS